MTNLITTVYVKKIGSKNKCFKSNIEYDTSLDDKDAERIREEIINLPTILNAQILKVIPDSMPFPVGFEVTGSDPSAVYQLITSCGYAITKSNIKSR